MRAGLSGWTAGLVGDRDPAQPLLTLLDGPARVELSGATTANWVAKSAWLLHDGHGAPDRVGLLLPLHWQAVCLLLAGVTAGATVVVTDDPAGLAGCAVAFTTRGTAEAALDAGVDDVLALSATPLGTPCPDLPPMVLDYAREVPSYADAWSGPRTDGWAVEVGGAALDELPDLGLSGSDRVLTSLPLSAPAGLAGLLAALRAGAGVVLAPDPAGLDLAAAVAAERVTATLTADGGAVRAVRTA